MGSIQLKDGNKVLDPITSILSNTFGDPRNTADLMLLEFEIAKEDAILELLEEGELVQMDLSSEEPVLKRCGDGTVRVLAR
jgi:hypothetical protein